MFSRLWTSVLFFLFVLDALLRFELLRFEVVEQINKKVDLSCLKTSQMLVHITDADSGMIAVSSFDTL